MRKTAFSESATMSSFTNPLLLTKTSDQQPAAGSGHCYLKPSQPDTFMRMSFCTP